jgi:hypothetical protein
MADSRLALERQRTVIGDNALTGEDFNLAKSGKPFDDSFRPPAGLRADQLSLRAIPA